MAKHTHDGINRREFLGRTSRSAIAGGMLGAAAHTPTVLAQAPEQAPPAAAQPGAGLLVGWSTVSITPDKPVQLHGQFHERVSERVLDPCLATALALERSGENGAEQAIMVSCDLVNVQRGVAEDVRKRVAQELPDFDARKLFINCTHTHTGPTMTWPQNPDPGMSCRIRGILCPEGRSGRGRGMESASRRRCQPRRRACRRRVQPRCEV